jgi:UDP:flavonoid glycosyltransferase YjiC (YdhE family)
MQKNILICPLEWGLGHAARMIPVAGKLREKGNNVIIASGEEHLALFRTEFPGIACISFPGFKPLYSSYLPQYIYLLFKIPSLIRHIIAEHKMLKRIIAEYAIDIVISDNRFGLWNRKIISVYVTHMPLIPLPKKFRFAEPLGILLHRMIINQYTFCFIPDLPGDLNLTGRLSHSLNLPANVRYIGILSRFNAANHGKPVKLFMNAVILSGPEPQKEILKQKLLGLFRGKAFKTVIFEGKPAKGTGHEIHGNIISYSHLSSKEMEEIIAASENIISRSGYSTIMELVSMGRTAMIIPTPGQTEQEYLADYLSAKGWFDTIAQSEIKSDFLYNSGNQAWTEEINVQSCNLLDSALQELLEKHHEKS